jgi:glucose/arabinose dehydrogenase
VERFIVRSHLIAFCALTLASCNDSNAQNGKYGANDGTPPFKMTEIAKLDEPWAMAFLPDGRILVTEKRGALRLLNRDRTLGTVTGTPRVDYGGQGGLGDVALHPDFARNHLVYLSWAEAGTGDRRGAAVGRGTLMLDDKGSGRIEGLTVIWRQEPKVSGRGHYSHRLLFSPDGYLFVSSGERQKFTPAQDLAVNLGKVLRLRDDGTPAPGNPFADKGPIASQIWTLGHRNILGLAFDSAGRLWESEMGPFGGDEINLISPGKNYGWPVVSQGDNYNGTPIPDHPSHPEFEAPKIWWNPSISPSSLTIYSGGMFPQWRGSAFVSALSGKALIRITLNGTDAKKADQWDMGERIRQVKEGPDGALWMLTDGTGGTLLRLTPADRM